MQLTRVIFADQSTMSIVLAEMIWESLNRSSGIDVSVIYDNKRFNEIGKRKHNANAASGGRDCIKRQARPQLGVDYPAAICAAFSTSTSAWRIEA